MVACDSNNDHNNQNKQTNGSENTEENELTFLGDGDNWSADLLVVHRDEQETTEFKLTYEGDNVKSVESVNYDVQESGSFDHNGARLNEEGYIKDSGSCSGCAFIKEDTEVVVTVEWNDQTETFQLKPE